MARVIINSLIIDHPSLIHVTTFNQQVGGRFVKEDLIMFTSLIFLDQSVLRLLAIPEMT